MAAVDALTWLILTPFVATPLIYLAGRIWMRRDGEPALNPAKWLSLLAFLIAGVFLYFAGNSLLKDGAVVIHVGIIALRFDGISLLVSLVALGLGIAAVVFSFAYLKGEEDEEKFYALLTAMIGSILGLSCAQDLFNLWLWFECMAVSSYMLVSFYKHQPDALEAGFKYLVQSAAGSALALAGIALIFGQTGSLDVCVIHSAAQKGNLALLAGGGLAWIGFGVKAALVPLHTWLPDAHSQAPSGISALLSGIVIEAGLIAMLKTLSALAGITASWGTLLCLFGAVNVLLGNLLALRQTQVKRMLAFSSIAHVGYILAGLGIGISFLQADGAQGAFFHLLTHGLMKGLAFLAVGALLYALYLARGKHDPLTVSDLNGAAQRYPLAALTLSIAVLGLAGLPPLAGFMSKWQMIAAGFETRDVWCILLVLFMAVNSVLSLGYYAPLVSRMYRREPSEAVLAGMPVPWSMKVVLLLLGLAVVALGVAPMLANWITAPAGESLLALFGGFR
jgi:proton-translocating NADH-quinone oxidoreductase chain N